MLTQIKQVAALELKNLYGLNVLRHTKDPSLKKRTILLGAVWAVLIVMIFGYVGGLVYGLLYLNMGSVAPAYLITIASLVIFMFGIFKTGGVIFNRNGYDILTSLPLTQTAVVVGRFVRMYAEDLLMTLVVMIPGGAVYAAVGRPAWYFYPMWLIVTLLIPLLPLSIATLLGAVVAAVSSRMKNKSIMESVLSVGLALVIIWGSSQLGMSTESLTPEMLADLAGLYAKLLGQIYPPSLWLGSAMTDGNVLLLALAMLVYTAVFAAVLAFTARNFHAVCRRLNVTNAKHDYRMEQLQKNSVLGSLWRREIRRYFASGIYVTNTIMGPIMGTIAAAAYLIAGAESVNSLLGIDIDLGKWLPFVMAGSFAMMPAAAVSVSMEGKNWWITKHLPLTTKNVMDAKLLMNLSVMLPFYLVSELLMLLAIKPDLMGLVWLIVIPAVVIVFACVFALRMNLLLPKFEWDSEVYVVKQSAAAAVGGFGGLLATVVFALVVGFLPVANENVIKLACTLILVGATKLLYQQLISTDLRKL